MNLTNELLEMWEEEARANKPNHTSANAHVLHLLGALTEARKTANVLHERLLKMDAEYRERWEARVA